MHHLDNETLSFDKRLGDDSRIPSGCCSTTIASSFFENEKIPRYTAQYYCCLLYSMSA